MFPYQLGNNSVGFHCAVCIMSLSCMGSLFTSCLWSPVLPPDSFWVGKFHAWFCQPTSCSPESTGCNFPLPSPEHFILLMSQLFDDFQDPLFGCILWKKPAGPSLTCHDDWPWCLLCLYLLSFILPSLNLASFSELLSIISSKQFSTNYCCHLLNI